MKAQRHSKAVLHDAERTVDTSMDYTSTMFEDGYNRAGARSSRRSAKGYDEAVLEGEAGYDISVDSAEVVELVSRDGAFNSDRINADEEGTPLGGTEEELDALEVEGKPVDRTDRMKY